MPRGYRCIVIAIVGWLILSGANHAEAKAQRQQAQSQSAIANALENIAATNHEQSERAKAAKDTEPCWDRQDHRDSDLCAQWKAADAAEVAAWWSRAGGILSAISLVAVAFALYLTVQSNRIARRTLIWDRRGWLELEEAHATEIMLAVPGPDGKIGVNVKVAGSLKNTGSSPIVGVQHFIIAWVETSNPMPEHFEKARATLKHRMSNWRPVASENRVVSQGKIYIIDHYAETLDIDPRFAAATENVLLSIQVLVGVAYQTIGERFYTLFPVRIEPERHHSPLQLTTLRTSHLTYGVDFKSAHSEHGVEAT